MYYLKNVKSKSNPHQVYGEGGVEHERRDRVVLVVLVGGSRAARLARRTSAAVARPPLAACSAAEAGVWGGPLVPLAGARVAVG